MLDSNASVVLIVSSKGCVLVGGVAGLTGKPFGVCLLERGSMFTKIAPPSPPLLAQEKKEEKEKK